LLFLSLYDSLRHRKTAPNDAAALTDTLIGKLAACIENGVLQRHALIREATEVLNRFDNVAVTHYTAFHPL
jgi:hypothetical protein